MFDIWLNQTLFECYGVTIMPRGSNGPEEISRIRSGEQNLRDGDRASGKKGSGVGIDGFGPGNKKGFGSGSMQKNPSRMPKPSF
jgi:L-aminopeptidase/D-esterase-like protein